MQINIPKIVKKIELQKYAEEFGEASLDVWVNPPMGMLEKLDANARAVGSLVIPKGELTDKEKAALESTINGIYKEQLALWSELLSQGDTSTRMSTEELELMVTETADTDPMFWAWVKRSAIELVNENRQASKKG